jgi:hypothetical protein
MVQIALKNGGVPVVGEGSATWTAVHIDDTVDLFLRVFGLALEHSVAPPTTVTRMKEANAASDLPLSAFEYAHFLAGCVYSVDLAQDVLLCHRRAAFLMDRVRAHHKQGARHGRGAPGVGT